MSIDQPPTARDRVVVGVDGSEHSRQALRWAGFLAHTMGAGLEAVTVWQSVAGYGWATAGWAGAPTEWDPNGDARRALVATLDEVFGEQPPPELQIKVREGNTAKELVEVSTSARVLVVGSRGHGGFAGLLLGSVSTACAEHARCPVFVVHGSTAPPP